MYTIEVITRGFREDPEFDPYAHDTETLCMMKKINIRSTDCTYSSHN